MVQYIRNRGTFLASMVNMTQRMDEDGTEERKEALEAFKAILNINFGSEYALKLNESEYNYYDNVRIELPVICNPDKNAESDKNTGISGLTNGFLQWDEVTSIVSGSKKLLACWNEAGGTEADELTLPNLNAV